MQVARIKLISPDHRKLEKICQEIKEIALKTGANIKGPIPLPTKRLKIPVRKSPDGEGSETYETWEMRIHKRLIHLEADERTLRQIMRIPIPDRVHIEIELKTE